MADAELRLADLFRLREPSRRWLAPSTPVSIEAKLVPASAKVTGFPIPGAAGSDIVKALDTVLQAGVGTVLANAWNKRAEFRKHALDTTGEAKFFPLVPHDVKWEASPSVRISLNNGPYKTVPFKFEAKFHIDGASVTIQNGRIMSLHTGKSWFEGKLMSGPVELFKRKSKECRLPGSIPFGKGIRVVPEVKEQ